MTEIECYNWDCIYNDNNTEICMNKKITVSNNKVQCITKKKV